MHTHSLTYSWLWAERKCKSRLLAIWDRLSLAQIIHDAYSLIQEIRECCVEILIVKQEERSYARMIICTGFGTVTIKYFRKHRVCERTNGMMFFWFDYYTEGNDSFSSHTNGTDNGRRRILICCKSFRVSHQIIFISLKEPLIYSNKSECVCHFLK